MVNIRDIIDDVVYYVRKKDFESAAIIVYNNNISLQELASLTIRIGIIDFAILADRVIDLHKGKTS